MCPVEASFQHFAFQRTRLDPPTDDFAPHMPKHVGWGEPDMPPLPSPLEMSSVICGRKTKDPELTSRLKQVNTEQHAQSLGACRATSHVMFLHRMQLSVARFYYGMEGTEGFKGRNIEWGCTQCQWGCRSCPAASLCSAPRRCQPDPPPGSCLQPQEKRKKVTHLWRNQLFRDSELRAFDSNGVLNQVKQRGEYTCILNQQSPDVRNGSCLSIFC